MKKVLLILSVLLMLPGVSAYYYTTVNEPVIVDGQKLPQNILFYKPVVDLWKLKAPESELRLWHLAQLQGKDLNPVREWGKDYAPVGLRLVEPLNVEKRWENEGYTAVYGVERQVIVPWQPTRLGEQALS